MNEAPIAILSAAEPVVRPTKTKPAVERYFYSIATVLLLVLTIAGFQHFYFHGKAYPGRPLTPPIKTLIITHGVAMSLWMMLAIVQSLLVAGGNRRLHMTLGRIAAVLAAGLVVLGIKLGIESTRVSPPDLMHGPLTPKQFMAVPVLDAVLFALYVAVGVWWRKRSEIHRPMMFLASLTAVAAAICRHCLAKTLGRYFLHGCGGRGVSYREMPCVPKIRPLVCPRLCHAHALVPDDCARRSNFGMGQHCNLSAALKITAEIQTNSSRHQSAETVGSPGRKQKVRR
jgi:hypothetical protein